MKTKTRTFDCVEMMHQGALRIYEETKGMTVKQELAYWRQRHLATVAKWKPASQPNPAEK